jgi:hypothetical protein
MAHLAEGRRVITVGSNTYVIPHGRASLPGVASSTA